MQTRRPSELECTAYHEAAHAAVAIHLGRGVRHVSIVADDDECSSGHCEYAKPHERTSSKGARLESVRRRVERDVMILFAGGVAEARFRDEAAGVGHAADWLTALTMVGPLCGSDRECQRYLDWLRCRTQDLIENNAGLWSAVEAIAMELILRRRISGQRAREVYRAAYDSVMGQQLHSTIDASSQPNARTGFAPPR